ncbi:MAG TPA: mechanosensitive ion channel family protein [Gemmatimonadaceae bacterium]|nr:mechanosensitive ion channel family protein [Gemmatimonadaceae bacterium]
MNSIYFGNTVRAWLFAAGIAVVASLVLVLIQRLLVNRLGRLAERTDNDWDDAVVHLIRSTRPFFFAAMAIIAAMRGLVVPRSLGGPLHAVLELLILLQIGLWATGIVAFLVERSLAKRGETSDRIGVAAVRAIGVSVKVVAWIVIVLIAIQNVFDRNVTALVTGLGVGGIALALAVQNILGDLLAAVAIVFDRPFDVGDFIVVGEVKGTVEQIGLKTTRLRSLSGEQVILGNGELLKSRLHNFKRMYERRAAFSVDVTYDTPPDVVERIPGMVRAAIEAQSPVRFDRCHFASFAESALRIEAVYYVLNPEYNVFMDIQQRINLTLLRQFNAASIEFAFPTRTMITSTSGRESSPRQPRSTAP